MSSLVGNVVTGMQLDWSILSLQLAITLAHFIWQGGVVGLVLWLVMRLFRDVEPASVLSSSKAAVRYWAACVALGFLPILAAATFCLVSPSRPDSDSRVSSDYSFGSSNLVSDGNQPELVNVELPAIDAKQIPNSRSVTAVLARSAKDTRAASAPVNDLAVVLIRWLASIAEWLVTVYLIGVGMLLMRLFIGLWRTHRWRNQMRPLREPCLLKIVATQAKQLALNDVPVVGISDRIIVPMVIGILRPVILLPITFSTGLSTEQIELILRHELAHIRRLDPMVNLIQRVIEALLFFHPVTWWISHLIRVERENCCDEIAMAGTRNLQYASALLQMAQHAALRRGLQVYGQLDSLAVNGHSRSGLSGRIHRLLGQSDNIPVAGRGTILTVVVLLVASVVGLTAIGQALDPPIETEWIRGTGAELELRIHGEIFDVDRRPAKDVRIVIRTHDVKQNTSLIEPRVEGSTFSSWVPVADVWSMSVEFATLDDKFLGNKTIAADSIRTAAIDGLDLQLAAATKHVSVRVVHEGIPVPNAFVKLDCGLSSHLSKSDHDGNVRFSLLPEKSIVGFTSWTDNGLIGGYQFYRGPTRDSNAPSHEIELFKCRPLTVRLVNEQDESPVPNLKFRIEVATPEPHFNYLGQNDDFSMNTDARGEAKFGYWPDWPAHFAYIELRDKNWVKANGEPSIANDVMTVRVKRSAIGKRKTVAGQLTLPANLTGGFAVELDSFNGEEEDSMDRLVVFADESGKFSASVLPDATYSICLKHEKWVSNFSSAILFDSNTNQIEMPELLVQQGIPVNLRLTAGSSKRPITNETASIISDFSYQFTESGETRYGTTHRHVFATSDESGMIRAFVPPGPFKASIQLGGWGGEVEGVAITGNACNLEIHRPADGKVTATIALLAPNGQTVELAGSQIAIRSIDKHGRESFDLQSDEFGEVSFESDSAQVVMFAQSPDGKFATVQPVDIGRDRIELRLEPTQPFAGRLLDDQGKPVANFNVELKLQYSDPSGNRAFGTLAILKRESDANGKFIFEHVPVYCPIYLSSFSQDSIEDKQYMGGAYLEPDQNRPIEDFVVESPSEIQPAAVALPIVDRYERTLRDARLGNFNLITIGYLHDETIAKFVQQNLVDHEVNPDCSRFMQLMLALKENGVNGKAFFDSKSWTLPTKGQVFVCAVDQAGQELENLTVDSAAPEAAENLRAFMARNIPRQHDAEAMWNEALAEAARSDRKVWIRISQRDCHPCCLLSRWLDDHHELIEQDYVLLKIDNVQDHNGQKLQKMLTEGPLGGIPFFGIYDSAGKKITDSLGPLGNIGFPSSYDGILHLKRMLQLTRQRLTDEQIDNLLKTLK